MGIEIERKFLVKMDLWQALEKPEGKHYRQGYLLNKEDRVVRIRIAGDQGFITIKGAGDGISRIEYEYEIPKSDAEEMLERFQPEGIEKIRYRIPEGSGLVWELDEFLGANQGLVLAEIELSSQDQRFTKPDWLGQEVSEDERYSNSSLALRPLQS
ncbi:CYTH domain-containing protein [Pedobacter psychroterrae]|uniref:CYTH domain-containing protein n=1 Tax=Pedobacter psychroterrae TaxID=2530453 RepID=A0A4R0NLZ7_9SPHI|nr:CYTH domain-containing protein [Pedobacter psychroterrae]TCD01209.1 CYTH domain-containing protein [Pedobacter psychroterrae]